MSRNPSQTSLRGPAVKQVLAQSGIEANTVNHAKPGKTVWIDLDNSPHVPFFLPIMEELRNRGFDITLTARNSYQVCELLKFHNVSCAVIGGHWGRHRPLKILGTLVRALRLVPLMVKRRPDLAVSHGSRAQILASYLLGIPTVTILDYEFTADTGFLKSHWIFVPHFIPDSATQQVKREVLKYPGLKEDVYVPRFQPDPSLRARLGLDAKNLMVTVRPPATEAHYHNPEAETLLEAALELLVNHADAQVILLPRNQRQEKALREAWGQWIANKKIIIPDSVVDGLNLIWFSDLVISGGGTMNREAAALGVPVYSIFRGRIGAVDRYLAASGRLVLLETVEDVRTKIVLRHGNTNRRNSMDQSAALECIVNGISSIAEHQCLPEQR
jgi:uncharacterized protein